ncbi:DUF6884 domain-containing protein [Blastococcus sp. TF02A-30]|uniref:DUF6884 domain-containing protein n=1 Tax=Blastococcus sp. TF02A-30 TaxID=2250580 RepID=UPI000E035186|nr:DUF6884 domain-containing protein [Blastococcus sp. TF02A-30]RBY91057.1 hypothetical protein DQ241_05125 [Blastococcus sp. TF02A-30]
MSSRSESSIWALLEEAAATLPEPFSRASLISWVEQRRPDVETSSISVHIQYATAGAPNRDRHPLGRRAPFLERVDRGLYRRHHGGGGRTPRSERPPEQAVPAAPLTDEARARTGSARVLLVGCSNRKASGPAPARELFQGDGFRRARDRAVRMGVPWFVLSAKYGLLQADDVVAPFDVYLADQPAPYRAAWGEWVAAQLAIATPLAGVTVEVHAGDAYCAPLREPLGRLGATVAEPLAGLRQGERLAWPGYREGGEEGADPDPTGAPDIAFLLDPANAGSPSEFISAGPDNRRTPGLYAWWVDRTGAAELSAGLDHPVQPGLLYVGKAGGHRPSAEPSSSTLWGRVHGNHLRGNVRGSTLRMSLAAILGAAGAPVTEADLTAWMHAHLRVAVLPVPSELVGRLEDDLVGRADPPLNLAGAPQSEPRSALSRLRGLLSRPSARRAARRAPDEPCVGGL